MKCSFSRLLYPKTVEEARDGSYMIALFRPHEKVLDAQGNRLSSIKVVGHYLPTVSSVKVDMAGHWKKDARYGLQFEMESYEELVESSKAGIVSYLSSGMIPGIGKKLAERIYDTFGEQSLEVLDRDPTRIEEVSGISQKKRDQFCDAYMETRSARKLINMLAPFDISAMQAIHLRRQLGLDAQTLLAQFPYMVFERDLIDFETADRLAQGQRDPDGCAGTAGCRLALYAETSRIQRASVHAQGTPCAEGGQFTPRTGSDVEGCCPAGI